MTEAEYNALKVALAGNIPSGIQSAEPLLAVVDENPNNFVVISLPGGEIIDQESGSDAAPEIGFRTADSAEEPAVVVPIDTGSADVGVPLPAPVGGEAVLSSGTAPATGDNLGQFIDVEAVLAEADAPTFGEAPVSPSAEPVAPVAPVEPGVPLSAVTGGDGGSSGFGTPGITQDSSIFGGDAPLVGGAGVNDPSFGVPLSDVTGPGAADPSPVLSTVGGGTEVLSGAGGNVAISDVGLAGI